MKRITRVHVISHGARSIEAGLAGEQLRSRLESAGAISRGQAFLFLEGRETRNCDEFRWRRARSNVIRSRSRSCGHASHTQRNRPPSRHRLSTALARSLALARPRATPVIAIIILDRWPAISNRLWKYTRRHARGRRIRWNERSVVTQRSESRGGELGKSRVEENFASIRSSFRFLL